MYHEWISQQEICLWQKESENVRKSVERPMDTVEYIYGLKDKAFITILKQYFV